MNQRVDESKFAIVRHLATTWREVNVFRKQLKIRKDVYLRILENDAVVTQ